MRARTMMALYLLAGSAQAEPAAKPAKIWNLTASVVSDIRLAPAGAESFGRNLALDDDDHEIALDERLKLNDTPAGVYDARITLKDGRKCRVAGLKIAPGTVASIEEKDLRDCAK